MILVSYQAKDCSMVRGGARPGSGRPAKDVQDKRPPLNCRINPTHKVWLEEVRQQTEMGLGELVDIAIDLLRQHPERIKPAE
jgi:hypothetical protein